MPQLEFHSDRCICDGCCRLQRMRKADQTDTEHFYRRESYRSEGLPGVVATLSKRINSTVQHPGASDSSFAVY